MEGAVRTGGHGRLGDRALLFRPGLIVRQHDPTLRFTYRPARVARAVERQAVLVPGAVDHAVQFIDVRDVAAFSLRARGRAGIGRAPNRLSAGA